MIDNLVTRNAKQLGEALRRLRKQKSMTQTEVGQRTNLRQATVSTVEAGDPGTQLKTLFDVLVALDLELVVRQRPKAGPTSLEDLFS